MPSLVLRGSAFCNLTACGRALAPQLHSPHERTNARTNEQNDTCTECTGPPRSSFSFVRLLLRCCGAALLRCHFRSNDDDDDFDDFDFDDEFADCASTLDAACGEKTAQESVLFDYVAWEWYIVNICAGGNGEWPQRVCGCTTVARSELVASHIVERTRRREESR